jgi:hypothetical protein
MTAAQARAIFEGIFDANAIRRLIAFIENLPPKIRNSPAWRRRLERARQRLAQAQAQEAVK